MEQELNGAATAVRRYEGSQTRPRITKIIIPQPSMGSKGWVLDEFGLFELERGPGVLRGMACTHTGTGAIEIVDGFLNEDGYYPDEEVRKNHLTDDYCKCNGRILFKSPGSVMGMWTLNIAFQHGLTIHALGGHGNQGPCITLIWDVKKIIKAE